jgi:hypothetical protein
MLSTCSRIIGGHTSTVPGSVNTRAGFSLKFRKERVKSIDKKFVEAITGVGRCVAPGSATARLLTLHDRDAIIDTVML